MTPRPHLHAVPRTLRRLGRDRSGAVAALVSLALPVLAGIGMLGVDAGVWYWERRTLQTAADAGAMAGAWHRYYRGTSGMTAAATAGATNNGAVGSVTVSNPPTTGAGAGDPTAVEVTIRQPLKLFYARAIGQEAATQSVAATASVVLDTNFCILGLDPTLSGAVTVQGTADITMTCGVAINSNSPSALSIAGGAQLTTTTASSVGGIDISGSPSITAPGGLRAQRPPVQDPYIDLEIPPWDPADCASVTVGGVTTIGPPPGSDTLVICSDIKVNSGDTLHLQEGTYILAGGQIQVMGGGTLTGDLAGTTLLLTDSPTNKGQVDIRGGAVVQLAAPTRAPIPSSTSSTAAPTSTFRAPSIFPSRRSTFRAAQISGPAACNWSAARSS